MAPIVRLSDSSTPLLAGSINPPGSFAQQGQLSWVDLGKTVVHASVNLLRRYSAANIDTYTILAGQHVAASFRFGRQGRERFVQAVTTLPSMGSMGQLYHFGFGVDTIIRSLATTEEGGCLVVLCAAAAECYQEEHAAGIMWDLVRCHRAPDAFMPSTMQWKALVSVCAGSLSLSTFPKIAEHFMSLDDAGHTARGLSSPDTMARALLGIGEVSLGKYEAITICGPSDLGWLAAIAEWMLDLRISISTLDGKLLHQNFEGAKHAQVRFLLSTHIEKNQGMDVGVLATTYHLRDFTEVINVRDRTMLESKVCGRVPWSSALSDTFGSYFKTCLEDMPEAFGKALGCAARLFEAVARAEPMIGPSAKLTCFSYFSSSHGPNFVSFVCNEFSELKVVRPEMDEGVNQTAENALAAYEACLVNISSVCKCEICKAKNTKDGRISFDGRFCLVCMLETILVLARSLSGISVAEGLSPLLSGLQAFYHRQVQVHVQTMEGRRPQLKNLPNHLKKLSFILELSYPVSTRQEARGNYHQNVLDIPRVADAARLFGRGNVEKLSYTDGDFVSAISIGGITVFLDILLDISDDLDRIGLCHVIPGRINAHDRIYQYISDLSDLSPAGRDYLKRTAGGYSETCPDPTCLKFGYSSVSLVALESIDSLQVGLKTSDPKLPIHMVGPTQCTLAYLKSCGLVTCTCTEGINYDVPLEASNRIRLLDREGLGAIWHFKGNMLSRFIALLQTQYFPTDPHDEEFTPLVREYECLQCCISTARQLASYVVILSKNDASPRALEYTV